MVGGYTCTGIPGENREELKCRVGHLSRTYQTPKPLCGNCLSRIGEKCKKNRGLWDSLYRPFLEGLGVPQWDLTSPETFDKTRQEQPNRKRKHVERKHDEYDLTKKRKGKAPAPPPAENDHPKCIQFSLYGDRCSNDFVNCLNNHPVCHRCIENLDVLNCPFCNKPIDFDNTTTLGEGSTSFATGGADKEEEEEEKHPDCAICWTDPGTFRLCEGHSICGDCLGNSVKGNLKYVKGNSFQCPCAPCPNTVSVTHMAEQLLKAGESVETIGKLYVDVQEAIKLQERAETMKKAGEGDTATITNALEKLAPSQVFRAVSRATVWRKTPCCGSYFSNDKNFCAVVYCTCDKKFCFYCLEVLKPSDPNQGVGEDNSHQHVRACIKNPNPGSVFPALTDQCVRKYISFEKKEHEMNLKRLIDAFENNVPAQEKDAFQEAILEVEKSIEEHAKSEAAKYGLDTPHDEVIVLDEEDEN